MQQLYLFAFKGRLAVEDDALRRESNKTATSWVSQLNKDRYAIAGEIATELQRLLPPSVTVQVDIQFREGSLEWEGVVCVLDWMARLAGVIQFVSMFTAWVSPIINRVLSRNIPQVTIIASTDVIWQQPAAERTLKGLLSWERFMDILTIVNSMLLLVAIGIMLSR